MCNILGHLTNLMLQLPNQAPYQLGHTRIPGYYTRLSRKKQTKISKHSEGVQKSEGYIKIIRGVMLKYSGAAFSILFGGLHSPAFLDAMRLDIWGKDYKIEIRRRSKMMRFLPKEDLFCGSGGKRRHLKEGSIVVEILIELLAEALEALIVGTAEDKQVPKWIRTIAKLVIIVPFVVLLVYVLIEAYLQGELVPALLIFGGSVLLLWLAGRLLRFAKKKEGNPKKDTGEMK